MMVIELFAVSFCVIAGISGFKGILQTEVVDSGKSSSIA